MWIIVNRTGALLFLLAFGAAFSASCERQPVLVHYMPWFESKSHSGNWGWHWTKGRLNPDKLDAGGRREIASHYQPLMDLYDSGDPEALACQYVWMKMAGIDGIVVDWYGRSAHNDYAMVNRKSEVVVREAMRWGLQVAICYEDRTMEPALKLGKSREEAVGQVVADLKWLADNWMHRDAYFTVDERPLLLVFGPIALKQQEVARVREALSHQSVIVGLPHLSKDFGLDGAFGWPPVEGNRSIGRSEWAGYLAGLYGRVGKEAIVGVAFPGYHDAYEKAKLHESYGFIDARGDWTLRETLAQALASKTPLVQIATWNDYGEGTIVEPTLERRFERLKVIRELVMAGEKPLTEAAWEKPLELYRDRKAGRIDTAAFEKAMQDAVVE
jgi:hypothetical protein